MGVKLSDMSADPNFEKKIDGDEPRTKPGATDVVKKKFQYSIWNQ